MQSLRIQPSVRAGAILLIVTLSSLAVSSLLIGPKSIRWHEAMSAVFPGASGRTSTDLELTRYVLLHLRLPRTLLALGVGVALALAGTVLQALWRNALADAGVLGISTAAALGAATTLVGLPSLESVPFVPRYLHVALGAFLFAAGTIALLYRLSQRACGTSLATLLLLGIAFNAAGSGLLGLLLFVASDAQLRALTFWTLGSVAGATWTVTVSLWVALGCLAPLIWRLRWALDALLLGESNAFYLGWEPRPIKRAAIWSAATLVAVVVAAVGPIAFVGLIVPHFLRLVVGPSHAVLLPASAIGGAAFVLGCDVLARCIVSPAELPLSVITAGLGGPMLLFLLLNRSAAEGL